MVVQRPTNNSKGVSPSLTSNPDIPIHHQNSSSALMEVKTPRVDLSAWQDPKRHEHELEVARLAFQKWGFAEFYNHDIPEEILDTAFKASKEFNALPEEEKLKCTFDTEVSWHASNFNRGYRRDVLAPDGRKRAKEHYICARYFKNGELLDEAFQSDNVWPKDPAYFKSSIDGVHEEFWRLANTVLMEVFSECLGIDSSSLREKLCPSHLLGRNFLFLHHYFQANKMHEGAVELLPGVPAHADPGAITIVVQAEKGVDGLQVLHDGAWTTIRPSNYSLIVNPGDCMRVWSNGSTQSMTHRVMNSPDASRFSMAYFVFPSLEMVIEPIPRLITEENPAHFRPFKLLQLLSLAPESKRLDTFKISDRDSAVDDLSGNHGFNLRV